MRGPNGELVERYQIISKPNSLGWMRKVALFQIIDKGVFVDGYFPVLFEGTYKDCFYYKKEKRLSETL